MNTRLLTPALAAACTALLIGGLAAPAAHAAKERTAKGRWTTVAASVSGDVRVEATCPRGTAPVEVIVEFRGPGLRWSGDYLPRVTTTTQGFTGERSVYATSTVVAGEDRFKMRAIAKCAKG